MEVEELIKNLKQKFTSLNSVPVTRATITVEEIEVILSLLNKNNSKSK